MSIYYRGYSVPMKPEMEKANITIKDEDTFDIPSIHYDGCVFADDEEFMFDWGIDSILIKQADHIVKYSEISSYDVLLKDEDNESAWYNGAAAENLGATKEDIVDFRPTKEYQIEKYDLEKSLKYRYKVILEETSEMDEFDHLALEKHFIEENQDSVIIDKY